MKKLTILFVIIVVIIVIFYNRFGISVDNFEYHEIKYNISSDKKLTIKNQFQNETKTITKLLDDMTIQYDCKNKNQIAAKYRYRAESVPVIYRTCRNYIDQPQTPIVIWLHGGPLISSESRPSLEQEVFLQHGFTIAEIIYTGAAERPWSVGLTENYSKTFVDTRNEVIEVANYYKRRGRKIIYAGSSFGGKILSSLLATMEPRDSVVLFLPSLKPISMAPIFRDDRKTVGKDASFLDLTCESRIGFLCDAFVAWLEKQYFGNYHDYSPTEYFRNKPLNPKIYIISGADDKNVGVDYAKAFTAAFPKSVKHLIVANLGHEQAKSIEQFDQIEAFLLPVLNLGAKQ